MGWNTQSGLTPILDALGDQQKFNIRQQGYVDAGILPGGANQPLGVLQALGIRGGVSPQTATDVPAPAQAPAMASPAPAALPALPAFAAGGGGISPNVQQALAYFQDKGLSPVAAQGLVGNFMRESGGRLDPNAMNPNGGATGIAQWLGDRARGLQQFASAAGRPVNDLRTQLDYAWSELSGPEKATLAALQKAQNPLQATVAGIGFERPEGWSAGNPLGAKDFSKRLAATVGIGGMPASATAYAPQGGGTSAPASQAIDRAAPAMPLATTETASPPAAQPSPSGPAASVSPAGGASPTAGGPPNIAQIQALLRNPETEKIGLALWQQSITPKDGFTLGQGQTRFDARGHQLAAVAPDPVTIAPGSSLVTKQGQAVYTAPGAKDLDIKQIGEDEYGNKRFGTINKATGEITPIAPSASPAGSPAATDPNLHGADYLSTLNPAIAQQVKAYAEGRVKLPTGTGANSPFARQMRAAVLQYDPAFDATNTDARFKTRTDFSPGAGPNSAGVAIQAGNTAIQHLGELSDAAEELNNSRIPLLNKVTQGLGSATGGNIAGTKFANILGKYVEEATKFYRGTGGTESDIQRDISNLSPDMSPAQLHAAIAEQVKLMQGKVNAMQDRWHQGMGPTAGDFPIIQPKSQAALDRIASRVSSATAGTPAPAAPPAPAASIPTLTDPSQVAKLPSGTQFRTPDGRLKVAP